MLCFHFLPLLGCSSFTLNPTPTQFPSSITISPSVKKKIHAKITNSIFDVNILFLLVKFWKTRSQKKLKTLLLILMSLVAKGMEFFECYEWKDGVFWKLFPPFPLYSTTESRSTSILQNGIASEFVQISFLVCNARENKKCIFFFFFSGYRLLIEGKTWRTRRGSCLSCTFSLA